MKIFVDDLRMKPSQFDLLFKDGESFIQWMKEHPEEPVHLLTLDHDLGEEKMSGYELVQAMAEMADLNFDRIQIIQFHTDNLIGFKNMYMYLKNAQKHSVISENIIISNQKHNWIDGKHSFSPYVIHD